MALASILPFDFEADILNRKTLADEAFRSGQNFGPNQVSHLVGIARHFPWLSPTAALGFAQNGIGPFDPIVNEAAQVDLGRQLRVNSAVKTLYRRGGPRQDRTRNPRAFDELWDQVKAGMRDNPNVFLNSLRAAAVTPEQKAKVHGLTDLVSNHGPSVLDNLDIPYTVERGLAGDIPAAFLGPDKAILPEKGSSPGLPIPGIGSSAQAAQPVVRAIGLGAATPLQEVQGFVRQGAEGISQLAQGNVSAGLGYGGKPSTIVQQTQSGQAAQAAMQGQPVDVGTGWLPDPNSETGKAAAESARLSAPTIGGHAFTLGRAVAAGLTLEPDTAPFDIASGIVDASVAIKADPMIGLLNGYAESRATRTAFFPETEAAQRLASDTGLYVKTNGVGRDPMLVENFFDSPRAAPTITNITNTSSPAEVWRFTNKRMPAVATDNTPLLRSLAETTTEQETRALLSRYAGRDVQPPMFPMGHSYDLRQATDARMLTGIAPTRNIVQPLDPNTFLLQYDRYLQNAHFSIPERNALIDKYLLSDSKDKVGEALIAGGNAVTEQALKHGASPRIAKRAGQLFSSGEAEMRAYSIDQMTGGERIRPGVVIDSAGNPLPSPELLTESLNRGIFFPNPRLVRRATSNAAFVFGSNAWSHLIAFPDVFLENWRPLKVGRPAVAVRITGDTQATIAANGYDSLFTHPLSLISGMVGANLDKAWAQKLNKVIKGRYIFGPNGEEIIPHLGPSGAIDVEQAARDDEIINRLGKAFLGLEEPGQVAYRGFERISRSNPQAADAMLAELGRLRGDPITQGLLQQPDLAAAKEWFFNGKGALLREKYQPLAESIDERAAQKAGEIGGTHVPIGDLNIRANSDALVESRLTNVIHRTGNDARLIDAIRTGTINDVPIWRYNARNSKAVPHIQEIFDEGAGPQWVKGQIAGTIPVGEASAARQRVRNVTDAWMHALMTVPDKYLNQHPTYTQLLWDETRKFLPWASPEEYNKILTVAEQARLPTRVLNRLRAIPRDVNGTLTADQITYLAKGNTVGRLAQMTHNIYDRSNLFDTFRFIFPFGDAFRLIATRWAKTIWEHPSVLRRVQQGLTEARQSGFFHKDPITGEEVFTIPGTDWLSDQVFGVPVPLAGTTQGLSIVGEGYPGIGFGVTLPAQWFLPDTPAFDGVRDVIFPFGQRPSEGLFSDIANELEPSWLSKMVTGPPDQKTYNNTVGYMMTYLASTGDYQLYGKNAKTEINRLLKDAKSDAKLFYILRGGVQAFAPTAPIPEWVVKDKSGRLATLQVVKNAYQKHYTEDGPDKAFDWLVHAMGPKNFFLAQSFSNPIGYGIPVTRDGQAWAEDHPKAKRDYPLVYGLFAPSTGPFDITAFSAQFDTGERKSLSPEEMIAQAENRVGQWIYFQQRDKILEANQGHSLTKDQSDWLNAVAKKLQDYFPGFDTFIAAPYDNQKRRNSAITQLTEASRDPELLRTQAGQGLREYIHIREQALEQAQSEGYRSFTSARALVELRGWLRDGAEKIIQRYPDFRPMWEQVFSREMNADIGAG